jgi:hypothetical protein
MGPGDPTGQISLNQQCQNEKNLGPVIRTHSTPGYQEFDMQSGSLLYFYGGQDPYFERCQNGTCSILYIYKSKIMVNIEFAADNLNRTTSIYALVNEFMNSITQF